jgi:hypothetical protein
LGAGVAREGEDASVGFDDAEVLVAGAVFGEIDVAGGGEADVVRVVEVFVFGLGDEREFAAVAREGEGEDLACAARSPCQKAPSARRRIAAPRSTAR